MATARLTQQDLQRIPSGGLQRFLVEELGGSNRIKIELRGGMMVEVGAEWEGESRGGVYVPIGSKLGTATVTSLSYGSSEFTLSLDAAYMKRDEAKLENIDVVFGPEGLFEAFETIWERGRECLVQVGPMSRRGVLRKPKARPGRGYTLDPATGATGTAGVNLSVTLTWDWTGRGEPPVTVPAPASGTEIAGKLKAADLGLASALAQGDAFAPDFLESLSNGINKLRKGIADLRKTVRGIGSLIQAPARLANQALAAARSLGNVISDVDALINDTPDEYITIGGSARSFVSALRAKRALSEARAGSQAAADAVVALFDALDSRKRKRVNVRPGQPLSEVAARELGSANRWQEIAEANQIVGQLVPANVFSVELPPRGG